MNRQFGLSLRLSTVKDTVKSCKTAADIGCDHGYVSIALIEDNKADKVIACDINEGPLSAASENINAAGLEGRIFTRLSDGLEKITAEDNVDCIIIAGMGGRLMKDILERGKDIAKNASQLVLSPQSEMFLIRAWLRDNGFMTESEKMIEDGGKFYWIMSAVKGREEEYPPKVRRLYDEYSGYLIKASDDTLKKYLRYQLEMNEKYLQKATGDSRKRLLHTINDIESALGMME